MKNFMNEARHIIMLMFSVAILFTACEQDELEPEMNAAPGGGTLTTYKAYTLDSIAGQGNIYGRVVFWLGNADNTLVQVSLYNTVSGQSYPTGIYAGKSVDGSVEKLLTLYTIDGDKGEFSTHKFFAITGTEFYESLDDYDAHLSIFKETTIISSGDVGTNADPVATGD